MPPASTPRRWKRWIVGAVVLVLVLVVGIPFVYIHFIEGKAPKPLSLSNVTPTTVAGPGATTATTFVAAAGSGSSSTAVDGTWNVASGSTAGYRIKETLFGQSNTAVGRTSTITGSIVIAGTQITSGSFSVDMTTVKSDQSQRDGQFQRRIMDTSQFPTATFKLSQPIDLSSVPPDGATVTENATGKLTLHGTTNTATFAVQARRSGSSLATSGSIPVTFADYGINNPSGGPATTSDNGLLEFLLNFTHA